MLEGQVAEVVLAGDLTMGMRLECAQPRPLTGAQARWILSAVNDKHRRQAIPVCGLAVLAFYRARRVLRQEFGLLSGALVDIALVARDGEVVGRVRTAARKGDFMVYDASQVVKQWRGISPPPRMVIRSLKSIALLANELPGQSHRRREDRRPMTE